MEPKMKKRRIQQDDDDEEEEQELNDDDDEEEEQELNDDDDEEEEQELNDDSRNAAYREATRANRWRTEREQRIYSSKLLQAVRHVRRRSTSAKTGKEIHETADRVLAVSAKGATRWSRAILSSPLSLRLRKRQVKVKVSRLRRKPEDVMMINKLKKMKKQLPPLENKLRVLSRLIPGCRKVSSLNILEEATDYISALEMQVRAMTSLTALLASRPPAEDRPGFNVSS